MVGVTFNLSYKMILLSVNGGPIQKSGLARTHIGKKWGARIARALLTFKTGVNS